MRRHAWILTVAAVVLSGTPGHSQATEEPAAMFLEGDPARGRKVFVMKKCVDCHAILGSGGRVGPDLAEVGKGRSFYALLARLWDHSPRMIESMIEHKIARPEFNTREMADLMAYLYYLNYFGKPGDYEAGRAAFQDKACVRCHSVGGSGGTVGPVLDAYGSAASPLSMITAMWNHGPAMVGVQRELNVERPVFQGSEIADVLAYLRASTVQLGTGAQYVTPGDPVRGRKVFEHKQCAVCHPVHGSGEGDAPDLSRAQLKRSVAELAGVLWNHAPLIWQKLGDMHIAIPPFSVDEMTDLVAYLYFIDYYDTDGDAERGGRLFEARGCSSCHGEQAAREHKAPALASMKSVKNPVSFATAFWNHAPGMMEAMGEEIVPWPAFTESEMQDLACYLRGPR